MLTCSTSQSVFSSWKPTSPGNLVGSACLAQANMILLLSLHIAWCRQSHVDPTLAFTGLLHLEKCQ